MPACLSIYGKATVLRAYILSKIWYYLYLVPLLDRLSRHINKMINLTLWGSSKVCRWNSIRLIQPIEIGGLNILDTTTTVKAQHAWMYSRCISHPELSTLWKTGKSMMSRFFQKEYKLQFQLNHESHIDLKTITLKSIGLPKLTNGQKLLEQKFISISGTLRRLHRTKIRNGIKQGYWK